jgi:hypothetical protein
MALHEIRFAWNQDSPYTGEQVGLWTKKINLVKGRKHVIMAVDCFIDSLNAFIPGPDPEPCKIAGMIFLSPYPAYDRAQFTEFGFGGMFASDPAVLYKAGFQWDYDPSDPSSTAGATFLSKFREFPQETIAAGESFEFYSDHLYMTVYMTMFSGTETVLDNSHISMLVQLDDKEVGEIEHFMGAYSEYQEAQRQRLSFEAVSLLTLPGGGVNFSGQFFPAANFGGIRPERMVTGDLISQFTTSGDFNPEDMLSQAGFREVDILSRRMQPYNEAFGQDSVVTGDPYPDWLRFVRSEQFMMQERDVFPAVHLDVATQNVIMV